MLLEVITLGIRETDVGDCRKWRGEQKKELLADSNILYYDLDSGHTKVYICKKLVNYMSIMCSLYCVYIKCLYIFTLT